MVEERPRVGCGVVIFNDKGQYLMGKRKSKHGSNLYCVPGGWIEFGESFEGSVAREAMEEAGLELANIEFLGATNNFFPQEKLHTISIVMGATAVGSPRVMEPDKCESWGWYDDWLAPPQPVFTEYSRFITLDVIEGYKNRHLKK